MGTDTIRLLLEAYVYLQQQGYDFIPEDCEDHLKPLIGWGMDSITDSVMSELKGFYNL